VLSVNSVGDCARFRARLPEGGRVVIIGGGLIGCEFANDLVDAGHQVEVVDLAAQPLARLVPPAAGDALRDALRRRGVQWHLETSVERIEREDDATLRCELADGSPIAADVVLSAVGLRPTTGLAEVAGLAVERGIVVDRELRSSDPRIFALGDCAEVDGEVRPFVLPLMHGARALAATLAGEATPIADAVMPVTVKTTVCPLVVVPPTDPEAEWSIQRVEATADVPAIEARCHDADGRLCGFVLGGDCSARQQELVAAMATPAAVATT